MEKTKTLVQLSGKIETDVSSPTGIIEKLEMSQPFYIDERPNL